VVARRALVAALLAAVSVPLFPPAASAVDFSNPAPIVTPLPNPPAGCPFPNGCPSERADPFPSNIAVSGLTGTVTDVNVILRNLTYPLKPADVDLLVVAPGGKAVMLMSDACGDNSDANENPITGAITLTFDDQAGAQLPADGPCSTGTFRPVDDDDDADEFPLHQHPEDALPGGPTPPAITLPLAEFNGINPNGTWALFLVDDFPNDPDPNGNAGRIAGGWTLQIATQAPAATQTTQAPAQPTQTTAGATQTTRAQTPTTAATATTAAAAAAQTQTQTQTQTQQATTTTTRPPMPTTGAATERTAEIAAAAIALGIMLLALGYERRRRAGTYVVHFHL
jgi:hypothetical protein